MRTTLNLDDGLMRDARKKAGAEGRTLTSVIEEALRTLLRRPGERPEPFRLCWVTKRGPAAPGVDVSDRDALYERMEGRGGGGGGGGGGGSA